MDSSFMLEYKITEALISHLLIEGDDECGFLHEKIPPVLGDKKEYCKKIEGGSRFICSLWGQRTSDVKVLNLRRATIQFIMSQHRIHLFYASLSLHCFWCLLKSLQAS